MVKLTHDKLMQVTNKGIGITRMTAEALGETYPLKSGWWQRLLDKEVTEEAWEEALLSRQKKDKQLSGKKEKLDVDTAKQRVIELLTTLDKTKKQIEELKRDLNILLY